VSTIDLNIELKGSALVRVVDLQHFS
jgi:hypothetical protein